MNRREFSASMASLVAALSLPHIPSPAIPLPELPTVDLDADPEMVVSGFVSNAPLPIDGHVFLLPTKGLAEVNVSMSRPAIDTGSMLSKYAEYTVGLIERSVELVYLVDSIPELMDPLVHIAECRLEAHGWRIDGFLVKVEASWGKTVVDMRPTGFMEYGGDAPELKGIRL